jgi:hypothetical protein
MTTPVPSVIGCWIKITNALVKKKSKFVRNAEKQKQL